MSSASQYDSHHWDRTSDRAWRNWHYIMVIWILFKWYWYTLVAITNHIIAWYRVGQCSLVIIDQPDSITSYYYLVRGCKLVNQSSLIQCGDAYSASRRAIYGTHITPLGELYLQAKNGPPQMRRPGCDHNINWSASSNMVVITQVCKLILFDFCIHLLRVLIVSDTLSSEMPSVFL